MGRYIIGTIAYIISGAVIAFIISLFVAFFAILFFGAIGLVAGLFNGTGSLYLEATAFDGAKFAVLAYYCYAAYQLVDAYPQVVQKVRESYDRDRSSGAKHQSGRYFD